jgi:hypothetical protein
VNARAATRLLAVGRLIIGAVVLASPDLATRTWLHSRRLPRPATVLARATGARDVAIGAGALLAGNGAALRPWLLAGLVADATDLAATVAVRDSLPRTAIPMIAGAAGSGIALGVIALAGDESGDSAAPVPA